MKPLQPFKPLTPNFAILRNNLLDNLRNKQEFRVSIGKSKWINYTAFNQNYNLREILEDEVVIEFDQPKESKLSLDEFRLIISFPAITETAYNLMKDNIEFEIWDHEGKSPHLQIQNLPCKDLDKTKRKLFKQSFINYYVPEKYKGYTDYSLCGIHLLAIEWCFHWKKKYGVKQLIFNQEAKQ